MAVTIVLRPNAVVVAPLRVGQSCEDAQRVKRRWFEICDHAAILVKSAQGTSLGLQRQPLVGNAAAIAVITPPQSRADLFGHAIFFRVIGFWCRASPAFLQSGLLKNADPKRHPTVQC